MHRNHMLRNQLVSTLNPDSRYNVLFKHDTQKNPRIQYQQKSCQGSMKIKTQTTTQQKGKFLTLVSKPKKGMKKGKSNKKNLLKKSNSVILGGIKQSKNLTVQSEHSIQRSRCKSCTNFNLTNQNPTLKSQTNIQTSTNNNFNQRNIPMNLITQPNENNLQLTKIISHKLKMDTVQPHQFFTQRIILNSGQINNICGGFERRLLRNVSTGSVDRVYFSVGDEKKQEIKHSNQGLRLRNQKIFSTPRFDQTQQKEVQGKRRSRAGFIRSASAHKASPQQQKKISPMQSHKTSQFSPIQSISTQTINLNKPSTPKQQQIDQCISKMSLIRKQIDQIQSMIHQRLQSSQLRTKLMYGSQTPRVVKNQNVHNQRQQHRLFTHRGQQSKGLGQGHDNFNKKNIDNILNNNNSRILLSQSRTATIVNQLDNLSRSLSMSKCALIQSSKIQQRKNTNNNNLLNKNNILNLGEICNLIKHPQDKRTNGLLLSQQLIQKQYVGQSKTAASVRDRNVIDYQIDNNNNFKNSYNNNNNNFINNNNNNNFINNNNNFINNNNFLTMTKDKNYNQQNTLITKKNHFNNNSITNMTYNSTNNNHHPIIFNRLR